MHGRAWIRALAVALVVLLQIAVGNAQPPSSQSRVFEWTFESRKTYSDPFNEVDVDVIFTKNAESWRVPAFWRGGSKWTVRFAPPTPGEYTYHLESTDAQNADLNAHEGRVNITAYDGKNPLLRHGMLRPSANKRYFEHADGTPFYWLGDTWWSGLSDRLSWEGFQKLTADRKEKGFTVVQIVAGLVAEEKPPLDPGSFNEGGAVWDPEFKEINPKYFDYADRRIQALVDAGIAPAIVGAWNEVLGRMGMAKMKKHWRYIVARYGAYPVFWIVGGEIYDPPDQVAQTPGAAWPPAAPGWTEVVKYVHAVDPYHHPVTVHEVSPDDPPLQDESLLDFRLFQPAHFGWSSIAVEVAQLDVHRARTDVAKPLVVGEIGYEGIGGQHLEDFQRVAFWLGMLNGAAGHTYGANATFVAYTPDKPFQRFWKWSLMTWDEGMNFPGSYQIGLGAKLLQHYPWWQFAPHPEWVTPRGTTLLEPRSGGGKPFHVDLSAEWGDWWFGSPPPWQAGRPSEWKARNGNFYLPYASGIPGEVRVIYIPYFGLLAGTPPTVLALEPDVRYRAYYWEPSLGIKLDLGNVQRPVPGAVIREDKFENAGNTIWTDYGAKTDRGGRKLTTSGDSLTVIKEVNEADVSAAVDASSGADARLVLRFHDADNYVAAVYSSKEKAIYILDRSKGSDGSPLGSTPVPTLGANIRLTAEVRAGGAILSVTDGKQTSTTPIVNISNTTAGSAGVMHRNDGAAQSFGNFDLRKSPTLVTDGQIENKLYDARGGYRGEESGLRLPGNKLILLDAYRPEILPYGRDWLLVLESHK
jgi:Protein of unknown function (DUF4038)/Domain of unknown function (DUF5060)